MSLFGSSPDDAPAAKSTAQSRSLFDDEPTTTASHSSLFADDAEGSGPSPWDLPTPKKKSKSGLVKKLLPARDCPDSYVDLYDEILDSEDKTGSGISLQSVKSLLAESKISAVERSHIVDVIVQGEPSDGVGRGEFNVLLALIGLAQEHEDITLDGVDERRKNLPQPSFPGRKQRSSMNPDDASTPERPRPVTPNQTRPPADPGSTRSRRQRKDSIEYQESDPWASPELHKGHKHAQGPEGGEPNEQPAEAATSRDRDLPTRTTSTFTTTSTNLPEAPPRDNSTTHAPPNTGGGGWDAYNESGDQTFGATHNTDLSGGDFAGSNHLGTPPPAPEDLGRSLGGRRVTGGPVEEIVTVSVLPEKEGVFLFQHRNYQVSSARRASRVIRRYSDFVWLLDCLYKRYPFRQLPLLPPKRVAVNGTHLSSDASFIEKRRRGLTRFTNALVRHPILQQEQLVVMFLTVPTELAVWRKQATISVQEEFTGKALPPNLEDSLPPSLSDTLDTVRSGVKQSAEIYINLCALIERLAKRNEGLARDYLRLSESLQSLTAVSSSTYAVDTDEVMGLDAGLNATAKHLSAGQALLMDEARAWDEGVLEDLKRQRDTLVAMRDMFDRRDRLSRDNIPTLERRIESNEAKLAGLRGRGDGSVKPGEMEKVEEAIIKDKQSIVAQHARGVLIKECVRDEVNFFQRSQYHVSRLHQDWSQERVKYAELQADNWRGLSEEVERMPTGD
ncbi:MAG: Sorting nexin mvp1 [Caeruleum heppii]|nr:MAG: Sorting nexin mvp1 [Caeruleum heppii]